MNIKRTIYFALLFVIIFFIILSLSSKELRNFFSTIENKTFDLRQSLIVKDKKANSDIIILTIDDGSYEYLIDEFGTYPVPRTEYVKIINFLEKQNPKAIVFDLLFIKSLSANKDIDKALAKAISDNKNVYVSMNFDNQLAEIREPKDLDDKFKINIKNNSDLNLFKNPYTNFTNCRRIIDEILDTTPNVGIINVVREQDGIIRKLPILLGYKNELYPHLAFKIGLNALNNSNKDFVIDSNRNLIIDNEHKIPLDEEGYTVLNWYGASKTENTFKQVPLWKLIKLMKNEKVDLKADFFNNKIICIGATATALGDLKSTPVDRLFPGIEVHTTFINNVIDNSFIKKTDLKIDFFVGIFLALIVGYIVFKSEAAIVGVLSALVTILMYIGISIPLMKYFNIWVGLTMPISFVFLVFILIYILKYIIKSRDLEYTYKLATTDGLTELYNHRYFQEQMIANIETCKRYNLKFSMVLVDIDFFKKFNDTYGHQAGDAVLKIVSRTLKKAVRSADIVCRYGGEEISIILPNTNHEDAIKTAQKLCTIISQVHLDIGKQVTISLGVATYPENGSTPQELIEHADKGLYKAKENGRNQVGILD